MKDKEKVQKLIDELKALVENDFERRKIDVLERDLNNPPVVEIIDDKHQKFDGIVYSSTNSGHYVSHEGIHRAVYSYYFGEIPAGYEIHHVDEDKSNNAISNLQIMTYNEHHKLHMTQIQKNRKKKEFVCSLCGTTFAAFHVKNQPYCPACKKIKPRKPPAKMVKQCLNCGKSFTTRYKKVKFCSHSCAAKFNLITPIRHPLPLEKRICPVCGITFEHPRCRKKQCCSNSCAAKLRHKNRR